jgi:transposase-like protein
VNKELKRRSREVGAFVNDESLLRLSVSILININEEWQTGNRYLCMEEDNLSCPEIQG